MSKRAIVWFRKDLRIHDNPALAYAINNGFEVLPVFIFDTEFGNQFKMGAASKWWLHHSLKHLKAKLPLVILKGQSQDELFKLINHYNVDAVFWNRVYEPQGISRDQEIKKKLASQGLEVESFNANLLFEPWEIQNQSGKNFQVFTPFWKACLSKGIYRPLATIQEPEKYIHCNEDVKLEDLLLLPTKPDWSKGIAQSFTPGEDSALKQFSLFLGGPINNYYEGRNFPAKNHVSRLSPHLAFGEISPLFIWYKVQEILKSAPTNKNYSHFLSELGWREFSYSLLYHFPKLPESNFKTKFDSFSWDNNPNALLAWQKGMTGFPIVDAGMRELWQTGYMHNRVRMITASFLIKHLLIDWREGEAWFWDTLVDADLANNSASWQWVAGSGADAAPYFRIFNPILQGEKFDPTGDYVRKFVPEVSKLPDSYIHKPWLAPSQVLKYAGIVLGRDYPAPIVDHDRARAKALELYQNLPQSS